MPEETIGEQLDRLFPNSDDISILRGSGGDRIRRVKKMCSRLEVMFHDLSMIQNVIIVCVAALHHQNAEQDDEIAQVLRRCADDKLHVQLLRLTKIVHKFGGRTNYSEEKADDNS
jgi:hypothetical protein